MLFWRIVGGFCVIIFLSNVLVLSLAPELMRTDLSLWATVIPVLTATFLSVFLLTPAIIRSLLRKQFKGFHIRFVPADRPS